MSIDRNSMVATNSSLDVADDSLYKFFTDYNCNDERKRNIQFFRDNPMFSPKINFGFNSGSTLLGYSMEFIPGCITFKDAIVEEDISHDDKLKAINGIFSKLKLLHKCDIIVGDMHSQNIMFNSQDGYIVDLDEVRFLGDDPGKFDSAYHLVLDDGTVIEEENFYTDNVKTTICALSLLYGVDFEDIMHHGKIRIPDLKMAIDTVISDGDFKGEIFSLLDNTDKVVYFDDILAKQNINKKSEVL